MRVGVCARRAVYRHRAVTSGSEGRAASSAACGTSRWPSRRSRAIPRSSSTGRERWSRLPSTTRPEPERPAGHGRLPRYISWHDRYADLRERLDALRPGARRPRPRARRLRTSTSTGKRPRALASASRREHHADHTRGTAPGSLTRGARDTTAALEPTPPLRTDCGSCTLCGRVPDERARRARRVLDATACPLTGRRRRSRSSRPTGRAFGAQVYGCDICQDALSSVEPGCRAAARRARARIGRARRPRELARRERGGSLVGGLDRPSTVPRNDPGGCVATPSRAVGNVGPRARTATLPVRRGGTGLPADASWALARLSQDEMRSRSRRRATRAKARVSGLLRRLTSWRDVMHLEGHRALDCGHPPRRAPVCRRARRACARLPGWLRDVGLDRHRGVRSRGDGVLRTDVERGRAQPRARCQRRRPGIRHSDHLVVRARLRLRSAARRSNSSSTSRSLPPACASRFSAASSWNAVSAPVVAVFAELRSNRFHTSYSWQLIVLRPGSSC